jgi:predicted nucleic acid-binding Zn ribbon protein
MSSVVIERNCETCGEPLPQSARVDQRYCSGKCRSTALRRRRLEAEPVLAPPREPDDDFERASGRLGPSGYLRVVALGLTELDVKGLGVTR